MYHEETAQLGYNNQIPWNTAHKFAPKERANFFFIVPHNHTIAWSTA